METSWKKISVCPPDPLTPRQASLRDVVVVLSLKNQANAHLQDTNGLATKKPICFSYRAEGDKRRGKDWSRLSLQRAAGTQAVVTPRWSSLPESAPRCCFPSRATGSLQTISFIHLFTSACRDSRVFAHFSGKELFFFHGNTCICKRSNMLIACYALINSIKPLAVQYGKGSDPG